MPGPGCRLTLRYDFGLTIAVRDLRPDRLPQAPPGGPEPRPRLSGLFLVAALSWEWGVIPGQDDKTVWALLAMNVHGNADSHIDALCHVIYDGALYNGVEPGTVTPAEGTVLSVDVARDGIVGRGQGRGKVAMSGS